MGVYWPLSVTTIGARAARRDVAASWPRGQNSGQFAMEYYPVVKKQSADSVPFGEQISRNGRFVWCAYDGGTTLIATAASAREARQLYRAAYWRYCNSAQSEERSASRSIETS